MRLALLRDVIKDAFAAKIKSFGRGESKHPWCSSCCRSRRVCWFLLGSQGLNSRDGRTLRLTHCCTKGCYTTFKHVQAFCIKLGGSASCVAGKTSARPQVVTRNKITRLFDYLLYVAVIPRLRRFWHRASRVFGSSCNPSHLAT